MEGYGGIWRRIWRDMEGYGGGYIGGREDRTSGGAARAVVARTGRQDASDGTHQMG